MCSSDLVPRYGMWLQSPRWLIPKVALPQQLWHKWVLCKIQPKFNCVVEEVLNNKNIHLLTLAKVGNEWPHTQMFTATAYLPVMLAILDPSTLRVSTSAPVGDLDPYLWVYILSKLKPRSG